MFIVHSFDVKQIMLIGKRTLQTNWTFQTDKPLFTFHAFQTGRSLHAYEFKSKSD